MELPIFSTAILRPTAEDEPVVLYAPVNEDDAIYVHHPAARFLPKIPLSVDIGRGSLVVHREDGNGLQIVDGQPTLMSVLPDRVFRQPATELRYYEGSNGVWRYDNDNNVINSSLFRSFSAKVCEWALIVQSREKKL